MTTLLKTIASLGIIIALAGIGAMFAAILIPNAAILLPIGTLAQIGGLSAYTAANSALIA